MSIRLATLVTAAAVFLGGCAQGDMAGLDDLSMLTSVLPVDVIGDAPAPPAADSAEPVKAAAWSATAVTEIAPKEQPANAPAVTTVADWGASVYPGERAVSPEPMGPPMVAGPPPGSMFWGPAVVVSAGPSGGPTGFEPYILDTGDKLRVFVYGQPNLSRLYTVDQIGNIAIPLIGSVRARGRTTVDLEHSIAAKLGREFVKDPQVTVDVAQNRPFFILGEVRLPGQYPFVSGMTIEQAIAIGGGYTERASQRSFRITRKLGALVDQIEAPADYTLCPGDTVFVYERFF
jgi:polysaccharide biosynthesis/export protein